MYIFILFFDLAGIKNIRNLNLGPSKFEITRKNILYFIVSAKVLHN